MGVHGLTAFLRENKTTLAQTLEFTPTNEARKPLVVDGWSLIYAVWNNTTPTWVHGGDYDAFTGTLADVVRGWLSVGLRPHFVFDGPTPPLKFSTKVSRKNADYIQPSLLFFRTSEVSRSTPRFLSENRIPPPLLYDACIGALQSSNFQEGDLELHFADEEGDPYAVELAGRLQAYLTGLDSDYMVLNAEGYQGYLPLDEMLWLSGSVDAADESDAEFRTVRKPKANKVKKSQQLQQGRGIVPPSLTSNLTLSVSVYSPAKLASHLQLPLSLLPLLAAFLGNDYTDQATLTTKNNQSKFFVPKLTPSQRVMHIAFTLRVLLSPTQKRKKPPQDVVELIDLAVSALVAARPGAQPLASGEQIQTVENIVEATLQYALPKSELDGPKLWPTRACALHLPEACPLLLMFDKDVSPVDGDEELVPTPEDLQRESARKLYIKAYRNGQFSPLLVDLLNSSSYWPRLFLESPDLECVVRSIARPLSEWIFAVMDDAVGLPAPSVADATEEEGGEEDWDEVIDVVEHEDEDRDDFDDDEFSDPEEASVDALRGALQKLRVPDEPQAHETKRARSNSRSLSRSRPSMPQKVVMEYVRRGTRLAAEEITVSSITSLMRRHGIALSLEFGTPLALHPENVRIRLLLSTLSSDIDAVRALTPEQLLPVLALRWVVSALHGRAVDSSKEREKERWMMSEAQAFLCAFSSLHPPSSSVGESPSPPLVDRSIQLTAQVLVALETISRLAQTLLLAHHAPLVPTAFSGRRFHELLALTQSPATNGTLPPVVGAIWDAATGGLDGCFAEERKPKSKKKKAATAIASAASAQKGAGRKGMFDLLVE